MPQHRSEPRSSQADDVPSPASDSPTRQSSRGGDVLIEAQGLGRHYDEGNVDALADASFCIRTGQYVAIVGKSGSGKTTLLNLIGGLDRPTRGELHYDGRPLDARSDLDRHRCRNVGFVFQSYYLLPNLTAAENVQVPMFEADYTPAERSARAKELLEQVGLSGREDHMPSQLSGGEAQRVAIARALANAPKLILADEPTGALDSETGDSILRLLEELNRTQAITLIVVTHDEAVAARADHRLRLADGRIVTP
ncbi:Lipoprotein-releasing system ATP-binding protein LolD [Stieleria maiorica]|uniref:Lipoprotein-releasing system ATP-binding protein LolD n=1 Tax=Stieleria maiorica TaxID=2795974 RepID=A0A5B9M9G1_9BACT|nr:ABC transporter ATP-binding protein [Stieleria maiorica]QEF97728.1 Lipoprotein-releasing system ATP-binding protein LolD [Stieleria maiorica]